MFLLGKRCIYDDLSVSLQDGKWHYLKGFNLTLCYIVIAVCFFTIKAVPSKKHGCALSIHFGDLFYKKKNPKSHLPSHMYNFYKKSYVFLKTYFSFIKFLLMIAWSSTSGVTLFSTKEGTGLRCWVWNQTKASQFKVVDWRSLEPLMIKLFVNTPVISIFDTDSLSCGSIANLSLPSPPPFISVKLSAANHNIGCDVMIVCASVSWKIFVTLDQIMALSKHTP